MPDPKQQGYTLTAEHIRTLQQMRKWQDNFSVRGASYFSNTPTTCVISIGNGGQNGPPTKPFFEGAIPVLVTQTGGSAGVNKTSVCTFTYSIFHAINDPSKTVALATVVALTGKGNGWRALKLALTAGSYGTAYMLPTGTWKLIFVDECPAGEQDCS